MSNVALVIGGRSFSVACADGEEEHLGALGRMIDAKVAAIDGAAGQSESRMLLFAALMLADELHERPAASAPANAADLVGVAERLENLAATLEAAASDA